MYCPPFMKDFREIIDAWPSPLELGKDLGLTASHIRVMRVRNKIPAEWWTRLIEAAVRRKIKGVTAEILAELVAVEPDVQAEARRVKRPKAA